MHSEQLELIWIDIPPPDEIEDEYDAYIKFMGDGYEWVEDE